MYVFCYLYVFDPCRFVVVCGDGEYIIYTAMALRNKAYGSGLEFVWAADSNVYAVRETGSTIKLFKNFKEFKSLKVDYSLEGKKSFLFSFFVLCYYTTYLLILS